MYDLYFASQAPLEVNVTHPVRVAIKSTIEGIRANVDNTTYTTLTKVYDAADKEVFRLMMHDPYPRFRKSPEFETVASIVATSRAQSMMFDDV